MNVHDLYRDKPDTYFGNARNDIVHRLPENPYAAMLEIGCGAGATGAAALAAGKAGYYVGVDLDPGAAALARERLSEVVVGNAEQLDVSDWASRFDALIASEVLEHLLDPWTTLSRLATCIRPGGLVYASSPNVAHWRVLRNLVRGDFAYQGSGVMDKSHLRWFTPGEYRALFEGAGFEVLALDPIVAPAARTRLFNRLTGGRFRHLFMTQMMLVGRRR